MAYAPSVELLPAAIPPMPGEALFGHTLRNDEFHGAPSGAHIKTIIRYPSGAAGLADNGRQLMSVSFDLRLWAAMTGSSEAATDALTLRRQLAALFGPTPSARSVGRPVPFHVCPDCVAEQHFLGLETTLPLVDVCPTHGVLLVDRCATCGAALTPFGNLQHPFTCLCGRTWATLARVVPTVQQAHVQRQIVRAYQWILRELPANIVDAARVIAELVEDGRFSGGYESAEHRPSRWRSQSHYASLEAIVGLLIEHHLPPTRLAEVLPLPASDPRGCANLTCALGPASIRKNGARNGEWETYCSNCGSRFLGDRTILSFDREHGDSRLAERAVLRARARLVRYRLALFQAGRKLAAERGPGAVKLAEVFAEAEVPLAGYLRARRLRLVEIANAAVHGWPPQPSDGDIYAGLDARWRHPFPKPTPAERRRLAQGRSRTMTPLR